MQYKVITSPPPLPPDPSICSQWVTPPWVLDTPPATIRCYTCHQVLPSDEFGNSRRFSDGKHRLCKSCVRIATRNNKRKQSMGITPEQVQALHDKQGGVCAICGKPETATDGRYGHVKELAVDHDHSTGRIRGLLCGKCNAAIALFNDDSGLLVRAVAYLSHVG